MKKVKYYLSGLRHSGDFPGLNDLTRRRQLMFANLGEVVGICLSAEIQGQHLYLISIFIIWCSKIRLFAPAIAQSD